MIVVLPFHSKEVQSVKELLKWLKLLGGANEFSALVIPDAAVNWLEVKGIKTLAESVFKSVTLHTPEKPFTGRHEAPQKMFLEAARIVETQIKDSWLWLEPDCVFTKRQPLQLIASAYAKCFKPYMGCVVNHNDHLLPNPYLNGVAVYPADAFSELHDTMTPNRAFDLCMTGVVMPKAAHSDLFQHFWGQPELPPTFAEIKTEYSPINTLTPENIFPKTVLFHRNKDGTLGRLLKRKMFPLEVEDAPFTVVMPFHDGDFNLALSNIRWMAKMGTFRSHEILLCYSNTTPAEKVAQLTQAADACFTLVRKSSYAPAQNGNHAPVLAWQHAAKTMQRQGENWLLIEPDSIPLIPTWISDLTIRYEKQKRLFMRPSGLSVLGIYPADTPAYLPRSMTATQRTWKKILSDEIGSRTHNCSDLICDGSTYQTLPKNALLFHPNKNGALIGILAMADEKNGKGRRLTSINNWLDSPAQTSEEVAPLSREKFTVVWPFCNMDAVATLENLRWVADLGTPITHRALLSYEIGTNPSVVKQIREMALRSFSQVYETSYRRPERGDWPPTIAWHHAAREMRRRNRNWLWMESDAIALDANWIQIIQQRYDNCGKLFMGPVIPHMGHMNGTGVYPANAADLMPVTMRTKHPAWDVVMKPEMIHLTHDCSDIYCHRWGTSNGKLHISEGPPPDFNESLRKQIPETAVIFHRCKNMSLINLLRAKKSKNEDRTNDCYVQA